MKGTIFLLYKEYLYSIKEGSGAYEHNVKIFANKLLKYFLFSG